MPKLIRYLTNQLAEIYLDQYYSRFTLIASQYFIMVDQSDYIFSKVNKNEKFAGKSTEIKGTEIIRHGGVAKS